MAKRKSKKKSLKLWQWAVFALAAFGLYKALEHFIHPQASPPKQAAAVKAKKTPQSTPAPKLSPPPSPAPSPPPGPLARWDFNSAAKLLPAGAYPDNYLAVPAKKSGEGLLAYAKTLPGKKPGPQGLTHTQPSLGFYRWIDHKYQDQELKFSELGPSLEGIPLKQLTGIPQVNGKPFLDGATQIFAMKLFLENDPRQVHAFVAVDDSGARWATLADGKVSRPAAFWQGTTRSITRQFRTEKHKGKDYLILETGRLNEAAPYEGYRWKVDAFSWQGNAFGLDKEYSAQLTKEKR